MEIDGSFLLAACGALVIIGGEVIRVMRAAKSKRKEFDELKETIAAHFEAMERSRKNLIDGAAKALKEAIESCHDALDSHMEHISKERELDLERHKLYGDVLDKRLEEMRSTLLDLVRNL